jgi:hypothetical protein
MLSVACILGAVWLVASLTFVAGLALCAKRKVCDPKEQLLH